MTRLTDKPPIPEVHSQNLYIDISASVASVMVDSVIFHPLETYVRRVQLNEKVLPYAPSNIAYSKANMHSLFQGMLLTNVIKAAHRSFKYAGEPFIAAHLKNWSPESNPVFLHALGGAATGSIAAICLTPLDTLKVKKQRGHNRAASYRHIWSAQITHPYHAVSITLIRNSAGTAAFFACNSYLMHHVFQRDHHATLTMGQKLMNSTLCPIVGILASYPADLIKTHMQAEEKRVGIRQTAANVMAGSGVKGLYRGLVPKLITLAPRASLSYFLYQSLQERFRLYGNRQTVSVAFFSPQKSVEIREQDHRPIALVLKK